jgi:hypothetical protein
MTRTMATTTESAMPRRIFAFGEDGTGIPPAGGMVRRELLGGPPQDLGPRVDALTAELRQRIATAARIPLIGSLLLKR